MNYELSNNCCSLAEKFSNFNIKFKGSSGYLKVLDNTSHACLAQSRPDSGIPLGCIEGIQVVPDSAGEHHRILHTRTDRASHRDNSLHYPAGLQHTVCW